MAACTAKARWVNVAQPSPNSPGSDVTTFTTTSRARPGWVTMALTSAILAISGRSRQQDSNGSGAQAVSSSPGGPQPFTAPAVRPDTMKRCRNRNSTTIGVIRIRTAAAIGGQLLP